MALVSPQELVQGSGRGQRLVGRIRLLTKGVHGMKDFVSFHLLVAEGLQGLLYVEAWRDHARRVCSVAREGECVELANLPRRANGTRQSPSQRTCLY